nr:unnamed protein product [Callosobruchus analis]
MRRMHWSRDLNLDLMRAYYSLTNGGNAKQGCMKKLENAWRMMRPELDKKAQQLSDQVRSILNSRLLTDAELKNVKATGSLLSEQPRTPEAPRQALAATTEITATDATTHISPIDNPAVINHYIEYDIRYRDVSMENRPVLRKLKINSLIKRTIQNMNHYLSQRSSERYTLLEICHRVYCAASEVCSIHNAMKNKGCQKVDRTPNKEKPPWERRLEHKINLFKRSIAYTNQLAIHLDELKQKVAELGNRLRRYRVRRKRYQQNLYFTSDQKNFFRTLNKQAVQEDAHPDVEHMQSFWSKIWSNDLHHEENTTWIQQEYKNMEELPHMEEFQITSTDMRSSLNRFGNWKGAGIDGIHNYC